MQVFYLERGLNYSNRKVLSLTLEVSCFKFKVSSKSEEILRVYMKPETWNLKLFRESSTAALVPLARSDQE